MAPPISRTALLVAFAAALAAPARDVLPPRAAGNPPAELPPPVTAPAAPAAAVPGYDLDGLTQLMLQRDPRLAQGVFRAEAAGGRAVQAGLYPNPVFSYSAEEIADRTGPAGIHSPRLSQEFVTGGKLVLARAAAERERERVDLELRSLLYSRTGAVRLAYYDLLAMQRRLGIL
ncbi:MAG: hypothetical protein ACRC33_09445, partial [Gemmataceae bacterium]